MKKIADDKLLHFSFSCIILVGLSLFFSIITSILITILIGILKEVYDKYFGSGFDINDIWANLVGILFGTILLLLK